MKTNKSTTLVSSRNNVSAPIQTQLSNPFKSSGPPPLAMFELAQILFQYGVQSEQYKEASARLQRERGGGKFWK